MDSSPVSHCSSLYFVHQHPLTTPTFLPPLYRPRALLTNPPVLNSDSRRTFLNFCDANLVPYVSAFHFGRVKRPRALAMNLFAEMNESSEIGPRKCYCILEEREVIWNFLEQVLRTGAQGLIKGCFSLKIVLWKFCFEFCTPLLMKIEIRIFQTSYNSLLETSRIL